MKFLTLAYLLPASHKKLIAFWDDVYGFKMSCMRREVVKEASTDVVKEACVLTTAGVCVCVCVSCLHYFITFILFNQILWVACGVMVCLDWVNLPYRRLDSVQCVLYTWKDEQLGELYTDCPCPGSNIVTHANHCTTDAHLFTDLNFFFSVF